jgi:hypothetical protein
MEERLRADSINALKYRRASALSEVDNGSLPGDDVVGQILLGVIVYGLIRLAEATKPASDLYYEKSPLTLEGQSAVAYYNPDPARAGSVPDTALRRVIIAINPGLADLLQHRWSAPTRLVSVPRTVKSLLDRDFNMLRETLPPTRLHAVRRSNLVFGSPPDVAGMRRYFTRASRNNVYISPEVVAASLRYSGRDFIPTFVSFLQDSAGYKFYSHWRDGTSMATLPNTALDNFAWQRAAEIDRIIENFRISFGFLMAHEMAHIYLAPFDAMSDLEVEARCDCYAVAHLRLAGWPVQMGIFDSLLGRSAREGVLLEELGIAPRHVLDRLTLFPFWERNLGSQSDGSECDQLVAERLATLH